uniref:DUF4110 domain-containing protein n=1 Tax=Trypanosoma congolense (strain IL3000) TaxID=1068625 RepID=G0UM32_TRYCI|nr:conserved hypothetical protein [Trypanosoma congolense IL3000]
MGKGRDKRKKHEDPDKARRRAFRQAHKLAKGSAQTGIEGVSGVEGGFNNEEAPEVTLNRIRKAESKMRTTLEQENLPPPSPRANVVFAPHPGREGELLVFGGEFWDGVSTVVYNDLYFYHIKRNAWSKLVTAVNPPPRSSSQGVVYKHYLLICGGEFVSQTQSQFLHFKDVWRFDAQKYEWEELKNLKGGPSSRSGHRMCMWRRNAVLFGGFYDNAQECHYYNDLWVLSHLDGAGKWTAIKTAPHGDVPHARSGHCMAVYDDSLFVYGGYSTEKFNRFKKSQATVHHDLWMIKLPHTAGNIASAAKIGDEGEEYVFWTKIRLGGIPPPICCGVSCAFKDKKMYLFGGVVDIESPGGKVVSSFNNDLFIFHMDTKRFYPVVLRARQTSVGKPGTKEHADVGPQSNNLGEELKALRLQAGADESNLDASSDDNSSFSDDDSTSDGDCVDEASKVDTTKLKESYEVNKRGQIYPHRRMDAALQILGNTLYVFGGQFECGSREVTMCDLFSLNLNRCDAFSVLLSQDLSSSAWLGKEDEASDAGSWESGSTVVTAAFDFDYDMEDEEEDDGGEKNHGASRGGAATPGGTCVLDPEDDGDEAPDAIPAELDVNVTPAHDEVDGITTTKGKKGLKVHKEQLMAQLSAGCGVPTPLNNESAAEFLLRTSEFWTAMAKESFRDSGNAKRQSDRRIQKEASRFANRRYREAKKLLEQLKVVEKREVEEARFLREWRRQKEQEWEEYERQQAEGSNDNDD